MTIRSGFTLALAALLAACQPGTDDTTGAKRSIITLTPVAPGTRDLAIGETLDVKVTVKTIEGTTTTPAAGATVSLTASGPGQVSPASLTLDATGTGTFELAACKAGDEGCANKATVTVVATVLVDGQDVTGNLLVTLRGSGVDPNEPRDCSVCGEGCLGVACTLGGEEGVCNETQCVAGVASDELFSLTAGLFNSFGEPLDPARIAINSPEPVEVRVAVTSATNGAAVKDAEVVVTAVGGVGLLGRSRETAVGDRAANVSGKTNDKGVFRSFVFAASTLAKGSILVQAAGLTQRFGLDVVKAGIVAFAPREEDGFYRIMGVAESGYREQNMLRFRLLDTEGQPFVGSATMNFEVISPPTGVTIFPTSARTDENSEATVNLKSGPVAGTVIVRATATVDNDASGKPVTLSDSIAIVGAKVNARNFAVSCEFRSIPGLVGNDCSFMRTDEKLLCTAVLGDRFNNTIGRDVTVFWSTEAGLFGPPSKTDRADPDSEPAEQENLGRTYNTLRTLNTRMPVDVQPVAGEPARSGSPDECAAKDGGIRTFNPRDGLGTFIVHTKGEEGFWDTNNNGVYDEGEPFIDLGEPYIDANDNGQYDVGEEFIDTNGDGVWTGPNGKWDADTTIWAVGHVLFTNHAMFVRFGSQPDATGAIGPLAPKGRTPVYVNWQDENANATAPAFSTYDITLLSPAIGEVAVQSPVENLADTYGFGVKQQTICTDDEPACALRTVISGLGAVDGYTVRALYTAPDELEEPSSDIIDASAAVKSSGGSEVKVIGAVEVELQAGGP